MIEPPWIVHTSAQLAAVIRLTVPREEIAQIMGAGRQELIEALAEQGIEPSGPWFTHHLRMDPAVFDFEMGVPVPVPIASGDIVRAGTLPATTVARTLFHGNYQGLRAAWREFDAWVVAQGHTPAQDLWECYVSGPELDPDPATWRTELNRPLAG